MTLQELSRAFKLKELLARDEEIIESLRAAACPGAQVLTGMPHTPGVKDKVGDLAIEIADMQERIRYLRAEIAEEEARITEYIDTIRDGHIRTIFRLRFIRCLTWNKVARVVGGGNTEDSVKKVCYRYIDANE